MANMDLPSPLLAGRPAYAVSGTIPESGAVELAPAAWFDSTGLDVETIFEDFDWSLAKSEFRSFREYVLACFGLSISVEPDDPRVLTVNYIFDQFGFSFLKFGASDRDHLLDLLRFEFFLTQDRAMSLLNEASEFDIAEDESVPEYMSDDSLPDIYSLLSGQSGADVDPDLPSAPNQEEVRGVAQLSRTYAEVVGSSSDHHPPREVPLLVAPGETERLEVVPREWSDNLWVVPRCKRMCRSSVKPTVKTWTPRLGRSWIRALADSAGPLKSKRFAVVGNTAAECLYNMSNNFKPHASILSALLDDAAVWVADRSQKMAKPVLIRCIDDFLGRADHRYLVLGPNVVSSLDDLNLYRRWFKHDLPVYRTAQVYLSGGCVDVDLLRVSVARVAQKHRSQQCLTLGTLKIFSPAGLEPYKRLLGKRLYIGAIEAFERGYRLDDIQSRIDRLVPTETVRLQYLSIREQVGFDFSLMKNALEGLFSRQLLTGARVVAFLVALSQQVTFTGVVAVVSQFLLQFPEELKQQWRLFELGAIMVKPQGGETLPSPPAGSFLTWSFPKSVATETAMALWDVVAGAVSALIGDEALPASWLRYTGFSLSEFARDVRRHCLKETVRTVAESLLVAVTRFIGLVKACMKAGSLEPLMTGQSPVQWCFDVHAVVTNYAELIAHHGVQDDAEFKRKVTRGLMPSGVFERFTPPAFRDYIEELFLMGERFQNAYRGTPLMRDIEVCMREVRRMQATNSTEHSVMGMRVQPFGVFICGPPGSGKTNLSGELMRAIGRRMGYPIEDRAKYNWTIGANFQDGLTHTQWTVVFDDIDQNVAPPVAMADNHYTAVLKVVNNAPFPVEQSDVALKGKISAKPLLALYLSNFDNARLRFYSLEHRAFWRRLPYYLRVKARQGYETSPGSGILDANLVRADPAGNFLSVDLFEYDPSSTEEVPMRLVRSGMSKQEVLCYLGPAYERHLEAQREFLLRVQGSEFCPVCFGDLGSGVCPCVITHQSGWEMVAAGTISTLLLASLVAKCANFGHRIRGSLGEIREEVLRTTGDIQAFVEDAHDLVRDGVTGYRFCREAVERRFRKVMKYTCAATAVAAAGALLYALSSYLNTAVVRQDGVEADAAPPDVPVRTSWKRAPLEKMAQLPVNKGATFTRDEIVEQTRQAYVRVVNPTVQPPLGVFGVAVGSNVVLTVAHILPATGSTVVVRQNGIDHVVEVSDLTCIKFGPDSALIKVHGLAGITSVYKKIWQVPDTGLRQTDEVVMIYPDRLQSADTGKIISLGREGPRLEADFVTEDGSCGLVYAAKTGSGWHLVAQHHAVAMMMSGARKAHGVLITQHALDPNLRQLAVIPHGVVVSRLQCSVDKSELRFGVYPAKSEFWTAVSHHGVRAVPYGMADPRVHGATMKTRVAPTIFSSEFADLEEKWCGERGYWRPPDFKGSMQEGKWVSPYSASLTPLQRAPRNLLYYWLAVADYLKVLSSLSSEGFSTISPHDAMVGHDSGLVPPVDLSTSVGMPFNRKKREFIQVTQGVVEVDDRILSAFDEMRLILEGGDIPAPLAIGMLKDEQVKPNKMPRVFNCLPFAYNWLVKTVMTPIVVFERTNSRAFECFVGINMTSRDCNEVVEHLRSRDESLTRLLDMDVTKQDKSEDGYVLDFVALVDAAKAAYIGVDPVQVLALHHADRNAISVFKNDFFCMGAQNPSGAARTVERNSIVNSLQQRYMYYRMKYARLPEDVERAVIAYAHGFMDDWGLSFIRDDFLTFRLDCALATYGDDALLAVNSSCGFYDPLRIPELGLEMGMVFTDAQKRPVFNWVDLSQVVFLRRRFVWDDECGCYFALLSEKSLAKMLVLCKSSTLSRHDHGAVLLSQVARELVYYGRDRYEEIASRLRAVAAKYDLLENSYFYVPDFDTFRLEVLDGSFASWVDDCSRPVWWVPQCGADFVSDECVEPRRLSLGWTIVVLQWLYLIASFLHLLAVAGWAGVQRKYEEVDRKLQEASGVTVFLYSVALGMLPYLVWNFMIPEVCCALF